MSDHDHDHDHPVHIKKYIMVFVALLIGTVITVGAYYVHLPSVAMTVALALFIASIKAFLVAGWFMHLIGEKKMIYGILASTVFFFIALMGLIIWSFNDYPTLTHLWGRG